MLQSPSLTISCLRPGIVEVVVEDSEHDESLTERTEPKRGGNRGGRNGGVENGGGGGEKNVLRIPPRLLGLEHESLFGVGHPFQCRLLKSESQRPNPAIFGSSNPRRKKKKTEKKKKKRRKKNQCDFDLPREVHSWGKETMPRSPCQVP